LEQGLRGISLDLQWSSLLQIIDSHAAEGIEMKFNHAANDSPRSGSSKRVTPAVWGTIIVAIVVVAIWFALR